MPWRIARYCPAPAVARNGCLQPHRSIERER